MNYHRPIIKFLLFPFFVIIQSLSWSQTKASISYKISIPEYSTHKYHVELQTEGWNLDTLVFKMPNWMPGYYQFMDYAKSVRNFSVKDEYGNNYPFLNLSDNTFRITGTKDKSFIVNYDVKTNKKFVANSYVDSEHAYIIPAGSFFYVEGHLDLSVKVKIIDSPWNKIATGLEPLPGKTDQFLAPNFDVLYDSPILIGDLEELPPFKVNGVEHRFIGYKLGSFDKERFMRNLKNISTEAVEIIGDVPFNEYTYIAIGPGRGGIEHLNSTTISFDGTSLDNEAARNRMMSFLAHEYFHHYNVKRIRPFELGPFDYEKGSKTNLLWVSEGLTVYYDNLIVKRAGLIHENTFLANLANNIQVYENNPGRFHQTLKQSSYNTWQDGPFATLGENSEKTISYYNKGPIVGLFLDLAIREATGNKKSLDNVMQLLYWRYYKEKGRGFTDAEFEQVCEEVAGSALTEIFEYVYTTKELNYQQYLNIAGLQLEEITNSAEAKESYRISRIENPNPQQIAILKSWLGDE